MENTSMVTSFYDCTNYEPLHEYYVAPITPSSKINFSHRHPKARAEILASFDEPSIVRVGILHGEYTLFDFLLAERTGRMIASCPADMTTTASFSQAAVNETLRGWDEIGLVPVVNLAVLAHPYYQNYYHFSLDMIPRQRHFTGLQQIMSLGVTERAFQGDLVTRSQGSMGSLFPSGAVRIRDPVLAWDTMSEEGIHWLRKASRISARPGERRIYARRAARGTRTGMGGGGLSESLSLKALLHEFKFETVDFGNGEHDVATQIAMLNGAGVILSPHSAGLTNLAYLNPPLIVIEVTSSIAPRACFMQISSILGFDYHGIYSKTFTPDNDIVVDPDELRDVLHNCIGYQS